MNTFRFTLAASLFFAALPAFAQRDLKEIPDPDPMKELEQLKVADGFEIKLFASDPDIAKPIHSNWDAKGRLWVATSSVYPQLEPGEVANDKIVILEDTDGDGTADKRTVFADGLLIPTGVLPAGNGAYVSNSTELLFMDDTDGDGKADTSRVVLSGFGTEDTHHILHTLRRGPGGYVYFNQSIYIHSNIETPWGLKHLDGGGIWKFRPETLQLNVWVRGFVNPWGHRFDDWGQEFATDGAFGEGINYVFPGAAFVTAVGAERILHGMTPGQPKHCGLAILSGRHLPEEYRGTFLTNDFRGHRVNRFAVEESQSGYVARQLNDFVWTDHLAFRPIDVSMGPDGAVYIIDWYNPIIQHGEVDFRDPRRDKIHGRVWRVSRKDTAPLEKPKLADASAKELVAALKSPERWERDAARQLIGERGKEELEPAIREFAASLKPGDAMFERDRLEALWALQSIDVVDEPLLSNVLKSKDHHSRAAGVRVLSDWSAQIKDTRQRLAAAVADEHPQVRLEAVNALRAMGDADAVRIALTSLDKPLDDNLDYALWLTAKELQAEWLPKVAADPLYFGNARRLVFALAAAGTSEALKPALALWDADDISPDERNAVAALLGRFGTPADLGRLASEKTLNDPALRGAALSGLLAAARERKVVPAEAANVSKVLQSDDPSARAAAAELVGLYHLEGGAKRLEKLASSEMGPIGAAAFAGLVADGRPAAREALSRLAGDNGPTSVRLQAVASLAKLDPGQAAKSAASLLSAGRTDAETAALTSAFLAVPKGSEALAQALKGRALPEQVALAALRTVSTSARKPEGLANAIREAGHLAALDPELTPEQLAALVERVRTAGDPRRGEAVFRRDDLQCIKCHAIGGAGGVVGPDMTSIGGSAQIDYLIESLLQPSKKIKEGYHTTTVVRDDGTIASGVLVRKTGDEIVIRDNNAVEIKIPIANVVEDAISPISLMPTGLTTKLRQDELVDLVAFLSRLGKEGDYRVPPKRLVRSWQVLDASPEVSAAVRGNGVGALARTPEKFPWRSVTSMVAGKLPIGELPAVDFFNGQKFRVVRFGLSTPQAGSATLRFSHPEGVAAYVGGEPVPVVAETAIELPKGTTAITLVFDESRFSADSLSIEVVDAPGSAARPELATSF
jgi:putative heme-binding domain-containing protein